MKGALCGGTGKRDSRIGLRARKANECTADIFISSCSSLELNQDRVYGRFTS